MIAGAFDDLRALAELLDIPIATTVSGQGVIAETDPHALGVVGSNGGVPSTRAVVDEADLVVYIGCRAGSVTTERWRSPAQGTRIVHIDSDPAVIGANYKTDVALVGDARLAVAALVDALKSKHADARHSGQERAARAWEQKLADFAPLANSVERPIRPEAVIAALSDCLADDATIVADPGTPCPYASAHYRWRKPGRRRAA